MAKNLRVTLTDGELRRLYLEQKMSLEDIGRLYGVSRVAVWKYCRDKRLIRRSRSEARLEAQKKGKVPQCYYDINEMFFEKWSTEMAYILGLIITDGCVSQTGTVSLRINDRDLLEKVRQAMESEHRIRSYKHQKKLYGFQFTREKMTDNLKRLGVLPKKSLTVDFPDIPDLFIVDFIRGVFDGDGSVFFEKRNPRSTLKTSFVSSSKKFIEKLEKKLQKLGMPPSMIYKQKTKNTVSHMIRYANKDSIKFYNILYKNVPDNGLYLERKRDKYKQCMRKVGRNYE